MWDLGTSKEQASMSVVAATPLAIAPDGKTLAAGDWWGTAWLFDTGTGKARKKGYLTHPRKVDCVAFTSDSKTLATGSTEERHGPLPPYSIGIVKLWDVETGKERTTFRFEDLSFPIISMVFSPNDKLLVVREGGSAAVVLCDAASGKKLAVVEGAYPPVLFSPDGKTLVSTGISDSKNGGKQFTEKRWDVAKLVQQKTEKK
jgi:WD40 repeat protein